MPRFLCLFIAGFPAWAAAYHEPALRGKPVLIYRSGRVIATSPEAAQAGVQPGWMLTRAQAQVPEAIALPHHAALTSLAWDEVLAALYQLTPYLESIRPGLVLADIKPESAIMPLAQQWQVRAGAASDRTTAELAAFTASIGTLNTIAPGNSFDFLKLVQTKHLKRVGVSDATIERLGWFGWHTVGHLRALTLRQLNAQFAEGELLYRYAQAEDVRPVCHYVLPPTAHAKYDFEEPAREPYEREPVLKYLVEQAHSQLNGRTTQMVTVSVETPASRLHNRRILWEATASLHSLHLAARQTLASLLEPNSSGSPSCRTEFCIARLELRLGGLEHPVPVQHHLFAPSRPSITPVLRSLEARFPGCLQRIVTVDQHAYLPEAGYRFVPLALEDKAQDSLRRKPLPRPRPKRYRAKVLPPKPITRKQTVHQQTSRGEKGQLALQA